MIVVLAVASLCLAEPEADPLLYYAAPYAYPYAYRPYYASGYAGPLPGHSYQSVHRLHKREADPQLLLNAGLNFPAPLAAPVVTAAVAPPVHAVAHAPVVKSVVETPAVVSHAVHATPLLHHAVAPVAPLVHHAVAPAVVATPAAPVVGLTPHDCVT